MASKNRNVLQLSGHDGAVRARRSREALGQGPPLPLPAAGVAGVPWLVASLRSLPLFAWPLPSVCVLSLYLNLSFSY